jgi:hypothetical protein
MPGSYTPRMAATAAPSTSEPPTEVVASDDRRLVRIGIIGAAIAFLGLSFLTSLTVKPFLPADESSNVDYALSVSQGTIPHVDEPVIPQLPGQRRLSINYIANHPPLYFLLAGMPLRLGLDGGHPMLGFYAARLLTVLLSVGVVVGTGILAVVLARRRRPAVAVGAAALIATSGSLVLHAAIIHNDGLATSLVAAQLVATVLVLRQGLRIGPCLLLVASASLGLLTRISAVSLVALSAAALLAAALLHPVGGWRRAILRGAAWACLLAAACALTSGWFYWRNTQLYGDPTAQAFVTELLTKNNHRDPPSLAEALLGPDTWHQPWRMFGADAPNGLPVAAIGPARWAIAAIWLAVAVGLVVLGTRLVRARRPFAEDRRRPFVEGAVAALLALHVIAVFLQLASHVAVGGFGHVRYIFPAWPVIAVVMAYAILCLPGRPGRALLALVVIVQAALTVTWLANQAARWTGETGFDEVPKAVRLSGIPAPDLVVALLAVVVICGLGTAIAIILRGDGRAPPRLASAADPGVETADAPVPGGS